MDEQLKRAVEALQRGAADVRDLAREPAAEIRERLRRTVEEVLDHLEAEKEEPETDDVFSRLDRQSKDIAEDLRRIERLMKRGPERD